MEFQAIFRRAFSKARFPLWAMGLSLVLCAAAQLALMRWLHRHVGDHDTWDSYTLQAMSWWKGKASLDHDYAYLELARFGKKIFVSFPPVPSAVLFFLVPFFHEQTPNNALVLLYTFLSFTLLLVLARRSKCTSVQANVWAWLAIFGSSLLPISVSGGVWFQAQTLGFLLLCACNRVSTSGRFFPAGAFRHDTAIVSSGCRTPCRIKRAASICPCFLCSRHHLRLLRSLQRVPFL
jgi:hypothetical protein